MVKNKNITTNKEDYHKAVLEVIEFSADDILTLSNTILGYKQGDGTSFDEDDWGWL